MVKTRLIAGLVLVAIVALNVSFAPADRDDGSPEDESEQWQRFSERCASVSLRTLSQAEADFLERDSGNAVEDFWTADVTGYYTPAAPDPCDPAKATCASSILAREVRE